MKVIQDVHLETDLKNFTIAFGNKVKGWEVSKEELKEYWKRSINLSKLRHWGDVSLSLDGKLIRSIWNADTPILRNRTLSSPYKGVYPIKYNKY
jgi:hypothetical protein